jgi:hypothetical protein
VTIFELSFPKHPNLQADLVGGTSGTAVPLVIFGGACLIAAGLTLVLPETLNKMLPETIEDSKIYTT